MVHRLICEIVNKNNPQLVSYPMFKYLDYIIFGLCDLDVYNASKKEDITNHLT